MSEVTVADWYMLTGIVGLFVVLFIATPVILLIFTSLLSRPRRMIRIPLLLMVALIAIPAVLVIGTFLIGEALGFIVPSR